MESSSCSINTLIKGNSSILQEVKKHKNDDSNACDIVNSGNQCEDDFIKAQILDEIKSCPAIFQSQQIGDPELTTSDKRKIAEELLCKKPETFLLKFGEFLKEEQLNYFKSKYNFSYEIQYYVKNFKNLLNERKKKIIKKNRRYEAMKRMEAEGNYFSEVEMEKREPLLYHQMVGQYLSEQEKLVKSKEAHKNVIPTFTDFLINRMEREEINKLVKSQQEEEDKMEKVDTFSEEEKESHCNQQKRWGEDWEEEKSRKKIKKKQSEQQSNIISKREKHLLLQEFQSIMQNNFLNGNDHDFNYSEVDLNPEYDSVELRTRDEEEKYFDEESFDASVCTDTGIEDY